MSASNDDERVRRPKMTDVAKAAGVSQSTVSMVLNDMPGARMAQATRDKILKVAKDMGYRLPRREATYAAPGRPNLIGYLIDETSTNPHAVICMDGARDAAWEVGCVMPTIVTRNNPDQTSAAITALTRHPALLGVVYSTIVTRQIELPAELQAQPVVLLNCYASDLTLPCVLPGDVGGGQAGAEYLIAQGHERIGFINGEDWHEAANDRLKGYRRALATADLPFDANLIRTGNWMPGSGYEATLSLMKEPRPPTAIFCANDPMATGAMDALRELGLRVPEDISLMGYEDQLVAQHTRPALTTVVLPNYEMGRAAIELLLEQVARPQVGVNRQKLKIDCPLVVRQTVAPRRSA